MLRRSPGELRVQELAGIIGERQDAEIGEMRNRQLRQTAPSVIQIKRPAERVTDLGKERRTANRIFRRRACSLLPGESDSIFGLPFYLFGHPKQLDKHFDFCTQYVRNNRREDVVDRTQRVTMRRSHFIAICRYENYRRMRHLLTASNQSGRLEAVH